MAADDLYFLRTGAEDRPYLLVRLLPGDEGPDAEASMEGPAEAELPDDVPGTSGAVATVLRDAVEYAMLRGYDLRIDLNGQEWPDSLGVIGNR